MVKFKQYRLLKGLLTATFLLFFATGWAQEESQLEQARAAYDAEDFATAIDHYEAILLSGKEAFEVYYNLGNAYFKTNDIPRSILNYERALRLNPDDEDLLYNLNLTNQYTVDKFEVIPELDVSRFLGSLLRAISSNGWAWLSIISFLITLIAAGFFYLTPLTGQKKLALGISVVFLLGCLLTFTFAWRTRTLDQILREAIVFQPSVTVLGEPREGANELFVVHEGTKVTVLEEVDEWTRVRLSDGNDGWAMSTSETGNGPEGPPG